MAAENGPAEAVVGVSIDGAGNRELGILLKGRGGAGKRHDLSAAAGKQQQKQGEGTEHGLEWRRGATDLYPERLRRASAGVGKSTEMRKRGGEKGSEPRPNGGSSERAPRFGGGREGVKKGENARDCC